MHSHIQMRMFSLRYNASLILQKRTYAALLVMNQFYLALLSVSARGLYWACVWKLRERVRAGVSHILRARSLRVRCPAVLAVRVDNQSF